MIKPREFYFILAIVFLINCILNSLAIYFGRYYTSDQKLKGLLLKDNALQFTNALIGNFYAGPIIESAFISSQMYLFNYTDYFPTPNSNTLNYNTSSIQHLVDPYKYASRCLQLETDDIPEKYLFYGYTVMMTNGTGLRGSLCQEHFLDNMAYAKMDNLCNGIACMRDNMFIGCIKTNILFYYHISDCGRLNQLRKNVHWSGIEFHIDLDDDDNMELL